MYILETQEKTDPRDSNRFQLSYGKFSGMMAASDHHKLIISEFMSFQCSDSCENSITKVKVLAKCSGKSPFSKYLGFQSNALEFSKCQMLGRTCGIIWLKKKRGWEAEFQERIRKEWACPAAWTLPARIQRWPARPRQFKPQKSVTLSWGSLAQLTRRASIFDLKNLWAICLLNIIIYCHCVTDQPGPTIHN